MNYPIKILPNKDYKSIECDISHLTLARVFKLSDNEDFIDPSTGNIKQKYIAEPTKHISDYSTNLLGVFTLEDIYITLTDEGKAEFSHYCAPDENVDIPLYTQHFLLDNEKKFFSINISDLINIDVPYEVDNSKFLGKCFVIHTPMKWNFWHFSLYWRTPDNQWLHKQDDKSIKKGWAKRLSSSAKAIIANFAKIEIPEFCIIDENNYKK